MRLIKLIPIMFLSLWLGSCGDDDPTGTGNNENTGQLALKLTDAPIDNSNIAACVVTISELRADGKVIEGFNRTTVDILSYQKGKVFNAGSYELEARAYSELELVLDHENGPGGKPGCYIEENDGTIHALSNAEITLDLQHNYQVKEDATTEVLLDFDLRKSIRSGGNVSGSKYSFVSDSELKSAIRFTSTDNGKIRGNCNDVITGSDRIIVYAYKKGSFERDSEIQATGSSGLRFRNAVNSTMCDNNGDFELHFLEEGDYELHFMAYDLGSDGSLQLKGSLEVNALSVLSPLDVVLSATGDVTVNVIVTGLKGL